MSKTGPPQPPKIKLDVAKPEDLIVRNIESTKLRIFKELRELLEAGALPLNRLEKIRGFLIYVARTYSWMTPFLKGLHLVIDSWRPGRDSDSGWEYRDLYKDEDGDWRLEGDSASDAPETVEPTGKLREMFEFHITSLSKLLEGEKPAIQY